MGLGKALFKAVTQEVASKGFNNIKKPVKLGTGGILPTKANTIPNGSSVPPTQLADFDSANIAYNKAVAKFKRTYSAAINRGSISDKQILKLIADVDAIDARSYEVEHLLAQGGILEGKTYKKFDIPDAYSNPAHYRKLSTDNTPPEGLLDNTNGFADLNNPAYMPYSRVEENAAYPSMGAGYRYGAKNSKKDIDQAASINSTVSGIKQNTTSNYFYDIPEKAIPLDTLVAERVAMNSNNNRSWLARLVSSNSKLAYMIGDDVIASNLTNNAPQGIGASAISYKGVAKEQGTILLKELTDTISRVIQGGMWQSNNQWKASRETARKINRDVTEQLLHNAQEFSNGVPLTKSLDPVVQQIVDTYHKSGFAEFIHKRLADAGHEPDTLNASRVPTTFSSKEAGKFLEVNKATGMSKITEDEFHTFMGNQIVNGHPVLSKLKVNPKVFGKIFLDKLKDNAKNGGEAHYQPVTAAKTTGITLTDNMVKDINKALDTLFVNDGVLSPSFKWDFKQRLVGKSGQVVSLVDFLDTNLLDGLNRQLERVSGIYGVAQAGLKVPALLDDLPEEVAKAFNDLDEVAREVKLKAEYLVPVNSEARLNRYLKQFSEGVYDPKKLQELKTVLDNVVHAIMGRAVGESLPAGITAASTLAALTKLVMSAVYNVTDQGRMFQSLGALNVLGTTFASIPSGKFWRFIGGKLTIEEAKDSLAMILARQKANDVHVKGMDNFFNNEAYDNNRFLSTIAYAGQTTPLWNLSEYVRRGQLFIVAQLLDREMLNLAKGGKGNKSLHQHLKWSGVDDETIQLWGEAIQKFGRDTSTWSHDYFPNRFEVEMSSLMDSIITKVKKGDNPEWFESSSVAKAILPFMAVQLALTNTLLRNTLNKGAGATLELLAYQAPFALAAVYLREVIAGRNPEDLTTKQLIFSYLSVLPTVGAFGILASLANQSEGGRGASTSALTLTFANDVAKSASRVLEGKADISDFTKIIPGVSINPVFKYIVNSNVKP